MEDTIAAIATPSGSGGIGVIRVSGTKATHVANLLFRAAKKPSDFLSHHIYHGDIIAPESGKVLDNVLTCLMKKPHSYTGEDTLEIYCHGGYFILQAVLEEILKTGCRLATPGEFTKRAFLNNRIDLLQAEAVFDMITARTEQGRELALSHLQGHLSDKIEELRCRILDVLAFMEISIDFVDDEMSEENSNDKKDAASMLEDIIMQFNDLLKTYRHGKILRNGINIVLTGKPNVGKSSFLNALLGEKRAIVTPVAGTTRDFIEELIEIDGIAIRITDTPGIRTPQNLIEQEGITQARERLSLADLAVIVLDGSEELTDDDRQIIAEYSHRNVLVVLNKSDLPSKLELTEVESLLGGRNIYLISAKFGYGLPAFKKAIFNEALGIDHQYRSHAVIGNIRHKIILERAVSFLKRAKEGLEEEMSPELVAVDLSDALASLGEITGQTASEEVLAIIFSKFCVGK